MNNTAITQCAACFYEYPGTCYRHQSITATTIVEQIKTTQEQGILSRFWGVILTLAGFVCMGILYAVAIGIMLYGLMLIVSYAGSVPFRHISTSDVMHYYEGIATCTFSVAMFQSV